MHGPSIWPHLFEMVQTKPAPPSAQSEVVMQGSGVGSTTTPPSMPPEPPPSGLPMIPLPPLLAVMTMPDPPDPPCPDPVNPLRGGEPPPEQLNAMAKPKSCLLYTSP